MEWISVNQKKPESGVHVLLCCQMASGGREDDAYYLEEGWYEVIKNWGDYSSVFIQDTVTHWAEMPELPKEDA